MGLSAHASFCSVALSNLSLLVEYYGIINTKKLFTGVTKLLYLPLYSQSTHGLLFIGSALWVLF